MSYKKLQILISKETFYDEDKQLYYKYVGWGSKDNLYATIWAKTEKRAKLRAEVMKEVMESFWETTKKLNNY